MLLSLFSAFRFIGQPSKEKAFHAQRKEREIEQANAIGAEIAAAASKAQKVRMYSVPRRLVWFYRRFFVQVAARCPSPWWLRFPRTALFGVHETSRARRAGVGSLDCVQSDTGRHALFAHNGGVFF